MIDILEGYMDQYTGSTEQPPYSPATHTKKAMGRINRLGYILHAWFPEVSAAYVGNGMYVHMCATLLYWTRVVNMSITYNCA